MSESVHLMTLTAATTATRKFIIEHLCMQKPPIVYIPPAKDNITYFVVDKPQNGIAITFHSFSKKERTMGRIIIFFRSYEKLLIYISI